MCFFGEDGSGLAKIVENSSNQLVESNITWICCDIAFTLEYRNTFALDITETLCSLFKGWCRRSWPGTKLQRNLDGQSGYYDQSTLLLIKSKQQGIYARKLENTFYTFLRDLNLSYSCSGAMITANKEAQGNAFRIFATAFEHILEEVH